MGKDDTLASLGDDREATSFDLTRRVVDEYEGWNPENIREHRNFLVGQTADLLNFDRERLLQVEDSKAEVEV